jgi:peptide chain release factor 1
VSGKAADETFANESGGHRWQRIPPTEKRGRVQTSTITVAVLPIPTEAQVHIREDDLEWIPTRGSGAGGQARNKVETAIILKHEPSGLQVRCETERSLKQNKETALSLLRARLWASEHERVTSARAADRRAQVGSGMRGDKRRTVRVQDGQVNDHLTGRQWKYKEYSRGDW